MTTSTRPSMAEMSGENESGGSPKLVLNAIKINGSKGTFVYQDVLAGLKEKNGKKVYDTKDLGSEIKVVFLKVRRQLKQFRKGDKPLQTNEHNHKGQVVTLFGTNPPEVGKASDLREKYQGLRTQQVVYALFNGELVRVFFRGASLGSQVKGKDEHDFYSYISSFKAEGKDEHFYEYETELYALQEEGELGAYYASGFRQGRKLNEEEMKLAEEKMFIAFDHCNKVDAYYAQGKATVKAAEGVDTEPEDDTQYPADEVSPDDIPF